MRRGPRSFKSDRHAALTCRLASTCCSSDGGNARPPDAGKMSEHVAAACMDATACAYWKLASECAAAAVCCAQCSAPLGALVPRMAACSCANKTGKSVSRVRVWHNTGTRCWQTTGKGRVPPGAKANDSDSTKQTQRRARTHRTHDAHTRRARIHTSTHTSAHTHLFTSDAAVVTQRLQKLHSERIQPARGRAR
jgi:hypothetical protein